VRLRLLSAERRQARDIPEMLCQRIDDGKQRAISHKFSMYVFGDGETV
jgi:hypothetical protein